MIWTVPNIRQTEFHMFTPAVLKHLSPYFAVFNDVKIRDDIMIWTVPNVRQKRVLYVCTRLTKTSITIICCFLIKLKLDMIS